MTKKTCRKCGADKTVEDFPKTGAQCKACIAEKAAARYAEKHAGAKPRKRKTAAAPPTSSRHVAGAFNGSGLMILQFHDGARIGPITTSEAGLAKMAYHVDLSGSQLDELVAWWKEQQEEAAT